MSRIPTISPLTTSRPPSRGTDLGDLDVSRFLDLMIAELQNQDPLNPMDNAEFIAQIAQIRQIGSTNKLTETLSSVLHGQQISTASTLIGKEISALSDSRQEVKGVVDRVTVERDPNDDTKFGLRVHVGSQSIKLTNIREIKS